VLHIGGVKMSRVSAAPPEANAAVKHAAAGRIRDAWVAGLAHGVGSALIMLATGQNIVLAAHYPLLSAAAIVALALGIRRGSRVAALLLLLAAATPAVIKMALGVLHAADLPAFPLALLYARGLVGTVQMHRAGREPR
jgi:hypothetical protein